MKIKIVISLLAASMALFLARDLLPQQNYKKVKATIRMLPRTHQSDFQSIVSQTKDMTGYEVMKKVADKMGLLDPNLVGTDIAEHVEVLQSQIMVELKGGSDLVDIYARDPESENVSELINGTVRQYMQHSQTEQGKFFDYQIEQLRRNQEGLDQQIGDLEAHILVLNDMEHQSAYREADFLAAEIRRLREKSNELLALYTPKHPDVLKLSDEITAFQQRINTLPSISVLHGKRQELQVLERKLFSLIDEIREAKLKQAQTAGNVQVIQFARPFEKKWDLLAQAKIFTVFFGFFIIVFLLLGLMEQIIRAVKSSKQEPK